MSAQEAEESYQKAVTLATPTSTLFGLFTNPPNYILALEYFQKAANLYRSLGMLQKAVDSLKKVAECQVQLQSSYLAAKALETAAGLANSSKLYKEASQLYLLEAPDRACEMLERAALASTDSTAGIQLFYESIQLYASEDRNRFSLDTYRKFIKYCITNGRMDECLNVSIKMQDVLMELGNKDLYHRQVFSSVILAMALDQGERAQDIYRQSCVFLNMESSVEAELCLALLNATTQESIDQAINHPLSKYLDIEILKVARGLQPLKTVVGSLQDIIDEEGYC